MNKFKKIIMLIKIMIKKIKKLIIQFFPKETENFGKSKTLTRYNFGTELFEFF